MEDPTGCCVGDGGRSPGVAYQEEAPNHGKLRRHNGRGGERCRKGARRALCSLGSSQPADGRGGPIRAAAAKAPPRRTRRQEGARLWTLSSGPSFPADGGRPQDE